MSLTAGLKAEHDPYVGTSLLPDVRLAITPSKSTLLWAAVSHAVRSATPFDEDVLRPSLIALFLSQLFVFAVYPRYRRSRGRLTAVDVGVATVAFALMGWGLWRAVTGAVAT